MTDLIKEILGSIEAPSAAAASSALARFAEAPSGPNLRSENSQSTALDLQSCALRLCGATHSPHPSLLRRTALLVAADHGHVDAGIDLQDREPSIVGVTLMDKGGSALNAAARSSAANLVLVDAGIRGGDRHLSSPGVLSFRIGDGTENLVATDAMRQEQALASVQTGIALVFSLADQGLDLLALGHLGPGAALAATLLMAGDPKLGNDLEPLIEGLNKEDKDKARTANQRRSTDGPFDRLAAFGGFESGVLCGAILAASAIRVPVILDGIATSAAALLATELCPHVPGYLFASHSAGNAAHAEALKALSLDPLFAVGIAQGEGTGAVLAMPMLEAAANALPA